MLDIGRQQSELAFFENGIPTALRIVFLGSETDHANLETLAQMMRSSLTGTKLFISGHRIPEDFLTHLSASLGGAIKFERLEIADAAGNSAAVSGLKKMVELNDDSLLILRVKQTGGATRRENLDVKKLGLRAGMLIAALLLLPYIEALLFKGHLEKKISEFNAGVLRLGVIDRQLGFSKN